MDGQAKAVLHGGMSSGIMDDLFMYDFRKSEWVCYYDADKIMLDNRLSSDTNGRYGHTAVNFRGNIVVFGGGKDYNASTKSREVMNNVKSLNIRKKAWCRMACQDGCMPEPRRNHTACIVNRVMIVIGGINNGNSYLKDIWGYSLEVGKWTRYNLKKSGEIDAFGIALHQTVAVIKENKKYSGLGIEIAMDGDYVDKFDQKDDAIIDGIYLFGGKNHEELIYPHMHILKLGNLFSSNKF